MAQTLLHVQDLHSFYGQSQALFGVYLSVHAGEMVTLLGRNGMGKTTTLKSILGLVRPRDGVVRIEGHAVQGQPAHRIARAGLGLVPEGRQIFPNLTVAENLVATAANPTGRPGPWTLERVFAFFPRLAERRRQMGGQLSGGEQQMLAIGRALMTNPKLLMLDEATEGLAPMVRAEIWRCLAQLKADGQSILVIDKYVDALTRIADRHYIIEKGHIAWFGTNRDFLDEPALKERYLGV